MNSNPSDLISYYSKVKKNSKYRESIEDYFYGVIFYYRDFYTFNYTIGDASSHCKIHCESVTHNAIFYLEKKY